MDACLFLLKNGVAPDQIGWVMPRDAWLFDRADIQGGQMFARTLGRWGDETVDAIAQAESIAEFFAKTPRAPRSRPATATSYIMG